MRGKVGLILVSVLLIAASSASARKAHLHALYSFCSQGGCADGREPSAGVVIDASGNLFGTTLFGGDDGVGVVYELVPNARKTKWKYKRLYSFCAPSNCADGSEPETALITDSKRSLYGVTMAGGTTDGGVAFKLTPNAKHTKWSFLSSIPFVRKQIAWTDASHKQRFPMQAKNPVHLMMAHPRSTERRRKPVQTNRVLPSVSLSALIGANRYSIVSARKAIAWMAAA
jgi:hypothetical protein